MRNAPSPEQLASAEAWKDRFRSARTRDASARSISICLVPGKWFVLHRITYGDAAGHRIAIVWQLAWELIRQEQRSSGHACVRPHASVDRMPIQTFGANFSSNWSFLLFRISLGSFLCYYGIISKSIHVYHSDSLKKKNGMFIVSCPLFITSFNAKLIIYA